MDIIETMYKHNKKVHEPIECTSLEEDLCKGIEDALLETNLKLFEDLQNEQFNNYIEKIKAVYIEGFKDAISVINQLNNI